MRSAIVTRIEDKKRQIEAFEREYLQVNGWKETSSKTPGSYWMWYREWEGRTLMAHQAQAMSIQERIDDDKPPL